MKNRHFTKILILFLLLSIVINFISLLKKRARHWLIYTPKPIGTYERYYSDTLFTFGEKKVFVNDQDGNTYGINKQTGKIIWKTEIEDYSPFSPTKLDDKNIAINGFDSNLYALDSSSGTEKWRFTNPNNTHPDTLVITDENDDDIFFGDRVGTLYAIDKDTGKESWNHKFKQVNLNKVGLKNNPIHFGKLFQDEDNLYIKSSTESKLIALDKKTGNTIWESGLEYEHSNILITKHVVVANVHNILHVIDKNNGQLLWKTKFAIFPKQNDINEQHIYLVSNYQELKKINLITGETIFSVDTSGKIKPDTIFIKNRGYLLHHIKGQRNNLIVFDINDGNVFWEIQFDSDITARTIFKDNFMLLGSLNGQIFNLDTNQEIITNQLFVGDKITNIFQSGENIITSSISEGNHATFTKISAEFKKIWSYKTPYKVATYSIHFNQDHIFFTDEGRQLVNSINIKSSFNFNQDQFSFETRANNNKKTTSDMVEFFDHLLPTFLKKSDLKTKPETTNSIKKWSNNYKQLKKNQFSIEQNYNQSILEITAKHNQKNMGQPLDEKIKLLATLTSPSGKKYNTPGFLYQKNTWKVHFRPDETGLWTYKLKLKTPPLTKNIVFYKNIEINQVSNIKFIKFKKSDQFNFYLEDDSRFYPLGLEDVMFDFNYDKNPLNQWALAKNTSPSDHIDGVEFANFDTYLKQYSDVGFNLYRWGVGNASFTLWKETSEYEKIDFLNSKYGDELVKELRKQNYHIMMTIFGFHPPFAFSIDNAENQKVITNYLDHVVPRYASYIDIWEITNEAEVSDEWLEFVINHIKEIDPYNHPISTNWDKHQTKELNITNIHWYDSEAILETALTTKNTINSFKRFQKPILFSEIGNVGSSWDHDSAARMRVKLWSGFFNQAYFVIWNQPGKIFYNEQNANIYLGPKERSYAKIFTDFIENTELDLKIFNTKNKNSQLEIFGLKNQDIAYIYITKTPDFENESKIKLPFGIKDITWINPTTGQNYEYKTLLINNEILLPSFNIDLIGKINIQNKN